MKFIMHSKSGKIRNVVELCKIGMGWRKYVMGDMYWDICLGLASFYYWPAVIPILCEVDNLSFHILWPLWFLPYHWLRTKRTAWS